MEDRYVIKDGKKLRCGFTTGTCAASTAKACVELLEGLRDIKNLHINVITNNDIELNLTLVRLSKIDDYAEATIIKDAGDDPDITDGMEIGVRVKRRNDDKILITGGEGIGIVKRKGLFGEVGDYAINPGPKKMIERNIKEVSSSGYDVEIFAPRGSKIAKDTYNVNMGIEGGISILGSTGIVEPMSEDAILKTIFLETEGQKLISDSLLLFPGNYGENMAKKIGFTQEGVKMSNYIGETVQYAVNIGFKKIILIGHIGKFAKLSLGAFNTHNRTCDLRMEAFVYYLSIMGAPRDLIIEVDKCLTSEEACELIINNGFEKVFTLMEDGIVKRLRRYVKRDDFDFKVHFYSMERGMLI